MKLGIIGSRSFSDAKLLDTTIHRWFCSYYDDQLIVGSFADFDEVISGGAAGADRAAAAWVRKYNKEVQGFEIDEEPIPQIKLTELIPDWDLYGKAAGILRNRDIVAACDMLLAFFDGQSHGTLNSIRVAKELKKPTLIIYF